MVSGMNDSKNPAEWSRVAGCSAACSPQRMETREAFGWKARMKMPGWREAAEACGPRIEKGSGCSPRSISSISAAVMPESVSGVSAIPGWFKVPSAILPSYEVFYWNASAEANACHGEDERMEHREFPARVLDINGGAK